MINKMSNDDFFDGTVARSLVNCESISLTSRYVNFFTGEKQGDFNLTVNYNLSKNFEAMTRGVTDKSAQVVDARRAEHFAGEAAEPTNFTKKALEGMKQPIPTNISAGHLPGAINLLEDLVIDPNTKCLLPPEELKKLFESRGINLTKPTTTMCYNGHAACLVALAMATCGKDDASVYYGSWTEYGQRGSPDLITKPKPKPAAA